MRIVMNYHMKTQSLTRSWYLPVVYFTALVLSTLFSACNHEPTEAIAPTFDPGTYKSATFPLFVGNQWVYVDSIYGSQQQNQAIVRLTIMTIDGYAEHNSEGTWALSESYQADDINYTIKNSIVYVDDSKRNGAFLIPRMAFLPAAAIEDTVWIAGPYPYSKTKVYALGHTYTTPAGAFDSVYVYDYADTANGYRIVTYFRPSIGILCTERPQAQSVDKSVLAAYAISK